MRASEVILIYFVMGAVMFGGGAVNFEQVGVASFFFTQSGGGGSVFAPAGNALANLNDAGGMLESVATLAIGGILLVWNLIVAIIGFLHWPIWTLRGVNAPPEAVLLLGGSLTAAFYLSVIQLLNRSS